MSNSSATAPASGIPHGPFAAICFVESTLVTVLQCLALPLFIAHADYRSRSSHQMMFCIGLLDLSQLVPYWCASLCSMLGVQLPRQLDKLLSAVILVCYDTLIMQHFLLALNRAFIVVRSTFRPSTKESALEKKTFATLICANWVCALCFVALYQTPLMGALVDYENIYFSYDLSLPYTAVYQNAELPYAVVTLALCLCLYLLIIAIIKRHKPNQAWPPPNSVQQQQVGGTAALFSAQERRILLQALALFAGMLVFELMFFFSESFSQIEYQLNSVLLIAYFGLNPTLYLTMNCEFRERFIRFYWPKSGNGTTTTAMNTVKVVPINNTLTAIASTCPVKAT